MICIIVDLDNKTFEIMYPKDWDTEEIVHDIVRFMNLKLNRNIIVSVNEYSYEFCISKGWKSDAMLLEKLRKEYNEYNSDKPIFNI